MRKIFFQRFGNSHSGSYYSNAYFTFDSLTGSWSVWPHVVTAQWLIKKYIFFQYYIIYNSCLQEIKLF